MRRDEVNAGVELLRRVDDGQLENLPCPRCGESSASAWFTEPLPGEYRIWVLCGCGFELRAQCDGKPARFSPERVRADLQDHDERIARDAKFPPE